MKQNRKRIALQIGILFLSLGICGCVRGQEASLLPAEVREESANAALPEEKEEREEGSRKRNSENTLPLSDGVYLVDFKTDSGMFRANEAKNGKGILTVTEGQGLLHVSLSSKNILHLYLGTADEAGSEEAKWLSPTLDEVTYPDGLSEEVYGFDLPVPVLGEEFAVALIGKKGKWYDHKVRIENPEEIKQTEAEFRPESSMELEFADQFAIEYYEGGYKLISLADGSRFLVVPEEKSIPAGFGEDLVPLYQPIENIYLAATSAMCLFDGVDRLDAVRLSGTRAEDWYLEDARQAMQEGKLLYAGKYSEPDYELLLKENCSLAIESMMLGHASEVKEKLTELGIPVLIDQSSMETHPLGRTEWIKLYGALLNEEEKAEALFAEQVNYLTKAVEGTQKQTPDEKKTAAFFHINSSGQAVVRKSGDYLVKMLELAGADSVFNDIEDSKSKTSSATLEMEQFFASVKDADYMIYNSTIGGEVRTLEELLQKSSLLSECKAVQKGAVWCTSKSMYQETTQLGQMIQSLQQIFSGEAEGKQEVPYFYHLQ